MAQADIAAIALPASRIPKTCLVCEEVFYRQSRGDRDGRKCCSRECGFEWLRLKAAITKRVSFRVYKRKPAYPSTTLRTCPDCGSTIYAKGQHRCEPCRLSARAESRAKAIAKSRLRLRENGTKAAERKARKLRLRGVTVETVNPIAVLDRDKWTCQLCGIKTPKRLRGTYEDAAPEVDHIIPIAQGGEHSYRNVQCACRRCNLKKSGEAKGQLRLFG